MFDSGKKHVLLASPYPERILPAIFRAGDDVTATSESIDTAYCRERGIDWIVAYGYRKIIRGSLLTEYRGRMVNLHIAYLPWNRGADPNFWSWYDDTPKGVSIHLVDTGIDTGDIIAQENVDFTGSETLRTSYEILCSRVEKLFETTWPNLRTGQLSGRPQSVAGTYHRRTDKDAIFCHLLMGWDTPVLEVRELGFQARSAKH